MDREHPTAGHATAEHDPVPTPARPDDPYRRPGDAPPGPATPPGRTGPVVLLAVGALAVVGLVVVLAAALPGLLERVTTATRATSAPAVPSAPGGAAPGGTGGAVRVGDAPADVEVVDGAAWTADRASGAVTRVDARTGATTTFRTGGEPTALVVDRDRVWVWNYSSALTPIAPDGTVGALRNLPSDTSSIVLSGDTLWYTQPDTGTVGRLDARSGADLPSVRVGGRPEQIAVDRGLLTVLDAGTVRAFDAAAGRPVGPALTAPAGTSAVVAAEGRRYVLGVDGVSLLGPAGAASLRYGPLAGVAVGRDAVWSLDTSGTLRRLAPDLTPLSATTGLGSGGDVAVGPDGRVWVLDSVAGTVRTLPPR